MWMKFLAAFQVDCFKYICSIIMSYHTIRPSIGTPQDFLLDLSMQDKIIIS